MFIDKRPVKVVNGQALSPGLFGLEMAVIAVIRHAFDIGAAGNIRFGTDDATVGILAHADRVGDLYPVRHRYTCRGTSGESDPVLLPQQREAAVTISL